MLLIQVFPRSYDLAIKGAQDAVQACRDDGKDLIEVEIPTAGLESVPGRITCKANKLFLVPPTQVCSGFNFW